MYYVGVLRKCRRLKATTVFEVDEHVRLLLTKNYYLLLKIKQLNALETVTTKKIFVRSIHLRLKNNTYNLYIEK